MSLDAATAQELIQKLSADREAYLQTVGRTHDLLIQAIAAAGGATQPRLTTEAVRRETTTNLDVENVQKGSLFSGEDSSVSDDDESLYVQEPLPAESYTEEGFRRHLKEYDWTEAGRMVLKDVIDNEELMRQTCIFPTQVGPAKDRSHLSHYSIFDVGNDGAPLAIQSASDSGSTSRSLAIWKNLKNTNADPNRERKAVGRITVVREPSPLLFAAIHYTMNKYFDMDEVFQLLVDDDPTLAHPHRAFDEDPRHRSTFVFTMEYFTIIGDECKPMAWQDSDAGEGIADTHLPVSRCSSVVALYLGGPPTSRVRNRGRRIDRVYGDVYDPFAPWKVLSVQAYPDWRSTIDSHDSTKHYVNGPEAFLVTLRLEFRDAQKRLTEVYNKITDLVAPPTNFMFNKEARDKLLFEDDDFTYSRRYFWAYQSLGIMNQDIQEMVTTFRETFTEKVWNGSHKIIWPGDETTSSRYAHWRKRMAGLRKDLENEMRKLEVIEARNEEKMKEIRGLRDNLFSGTSVLESRRSVQQAAITVQQGNNIKLLTLVTIFFLPLTFVTSVFGMTNMPPTEGFTHFAIVIVAVCVPSYTLIGSLNTQSGLDFWTEKTRGLFHWIGHVLAMFLTLFHYRPKWTYIYHEREQQRINSFEPYRQRPKRSQSATEAIEARTNLGQSSGPVLSPREYKITSPHKPPGPVKTNSATIRFGPPLSSPTSLTGPGTPTGLVSSPLGVTMQNDDSSELKPDTGAEKNREIRTSESNWFMGVFDWGRKDKSRGKESELC